MIKSILRYIAKRIYLIGLDEYQKEAALQKNLQLKQSCTYGENTRFTNEATIENHQSNNNKIIIGKNSLIRGNLMLFKSGGEIRIGDDCFVGPNSMIWSAKKIMIGNRVLISHNVNIHDNISHPLDSKERHLDFRHIFNKGFQDKIDLREQDVIIEDDVWIGFNCVILKGVTIGKCSIIGAGSIITKDVPSYSVVAGNPTRIIKTTS